MSEFSSNNFTRFDLNLIQSEQKSWREKKVPRTHQRLRDPASAGFHGGLALEQFGSRFGPSPENIDAMVGLFPAASVLMRSQKGACG